MAKKPANCASMNGWSAGGSPPIDAITAHTGGEQQDRSDRAKLVPGLQELVMRMRPRFPCQRLSAAITLGEGLLAPRRRSIGALRAGRGEADAETGRPGSSAPCRPTR